jgi:predicted TIM-barrel fold metal-dependent hydrolase
VSSEPAGPAGQSGPGVFDFHARLAPRAGALDRLLAVLDGCGIARAAVSAGGTIDPLRLSRQLVEGGHVESDPDNAAVLAACGRSGGRLVPFYFGNPHRPAERYAAAAADYRGLEISPAVHGVPLTDGRVADLVAAAGQAGHCVYTVCLAREGCQVGDLVKLAGRFPGLVFVLGHAGIGNIDYYAVELVAEQPNIMVETSGGYTSVLRAALDRLGAGRLLFGSEFPLQHPAVELAKYRAVEPTAGQWRQIVWQNADRLLGGEST